MEQDKTVLTKHAEDIPRGPFDCLDLRNHPDGKGPLAKIGTPDKHFFVNPETGQRVPASKNPDGTLTAHTPQGDVKVKQDPDSPDDLKYYSLDSFDLDTGEINPDAKGGELEVVKGEPGGRGDKKLVAQLQMFLVTLGIELPKSKAAPDGVDGIFGPDTDKAVKAFQAQHTDFNGQNLKQDGKVGPKTSDALNRAMVGTENEDDIDIEAYLTPPALTKDKRVLLLTATRAGLEEKAVIGPGFKDDVAPSFDKLTIVLVD